ncbi:MAG: DotI/IcmL/TraM family protein [Gammaproteobacteria bacterium]|nr:DotI/IcmL/TraM family protein [Gammaproteobacteria bacterium]
MANSRQLVTKNNSFYINNYQTFFVVTLIIVCLGLIVVGVLFYQFFHRPDPIYSAVTPKNQQLMLTPESEPNLLPSTLITWANKAVVAAYTFNFVNYDSELSKARPYFTEAGWNVYGALIAPVIQTVKQNQLFVSGVVVGPPVISNQGELPGKGYVWRIQLPFLVTYQSADNISQQSFTVILTIVKVPTWINPTGIGIDQFVMVG